MTGRVTHWLTVLTISLLMVSCSHTEAVRSQNTLIKFAPTPSGVETISLTGLAIGHLEFSGGCFRIRSDQGGLATIGWPNHFWAIKRGQSEGVHDPRTGKSLYVGDRAKLPGGAVELEGHLLDREAALRCGGPYLSADEI